MKLLSAIHMDLKVTTVSPNGKLVDSLSSTTIEFICKMFSVTAPSPLQYHTRSNTHVYRWHESYNNTEGCDIISTPIRTAT